MTVLQQTWFDFSTPNLDIPNYEILARKDRSDSPNRGGILTLYKHDLINFVFLQHSPSSERSWHLIQRNSGNIMACNYYRPPEENTNIEDLRSELGDVCTSTDDVIICGDLNVHSSSMAQVFE